MSHQPALHVARAAAVEEVSLDLPGERAAAPGCGIPALHRVHVRVEQDRASVGPAGAHADDVRPVRVCLLFADVVEVRCHLLRRRLPPVHGETALPEGALDDLLYRAFLPRDRRNADELLQQPHRIVAPGLYSSADLPRQLGVESPHGYVPLDTTR
jgi:hypothetical protein